VRTFDTTNYVREVLVTLFNGILWRWLYAFGERRLRLG
jgi:hypothetical protein